VSTFEGFFLFVFFFLFYFLNPITVMLDTKIKLTDLKVKSFVSILEKQQHTTTKAGMYGTFQAQRANADQFKWQITIIDSPMCFA
jgi:hypothetical protein